MKKYEQLYKPAPLPEPEEEFTFLEMVGVALGGIGFWAFVWTLCAITY